LRPAKKTNGDMSGSAVGVGDAAQLYPLAKILWAKLFRYKLIRAKFGKN